MVVVVVVVVVVVHLCVKVVYWLRENSIAPRRFSLHDTYPSLDALTPHPLCRPTKRWSLQLPLSA
jgi:hypothetical protein